MNLSSLLSEIPSVLVEELNRRAQKLIPHIHIEDENIVQETKSRFRPQLLREEVRIGGDESISFPGRSVINIEGHEVARYFKINEQWYGLVGEHYDEIVGLVSLLRNIELVSHKLSSTILLEASFEWLSQSFTKSVDLLTKEEAPKPFVESIIERCVAKIFSVEIWIPLEGVWIPEPFRIGAVTFKRVTVEEVKNWAIYWEICWARRLHPRQSRVNELFSQMTAKAVSGDLTVAISFVEADAIRAVERAIDEVERSLGALRFYSMSNFYPMGRSKFAIAGTLHEDRIQHLFVDKHKLLGEAATSNEWPNRSPEAFDESNLAKMREAGLSNLDHMLRLEASQLSPYEKTILEALSIYDRSTLTRDTRDKLLNVVIALESLLVRDSKEGLRRNVAYRMAYLQGKSLDHRRDIIDTYFKAYEARSNVVHRGQTPKDIETLTSFLDYAWHTLKILIQNEAGYKNITELLDYLDNMKFIPPANKVSEK